MILMCNKGQNLRLPYLDIFYKHVKLRGHKYINGYSQYNFFKNFIQWIEIFLRFQYIKIL